MENREGVMVHSKEQKSRWVIWGVLAVLTVVVWLGVRHIPSTLELLDAVDLPRSVIFSVKSRDYWEDWLNYVAGHEVIAAQIPSEKWETPLSWTEESLTLEELQAKCDIRMDLSAFAGLNIESLPETYDAWFFFEDEEACECWIGMYSRTGTLIVYRGLELWVAGGYWGRYD